MSQSPYDSGQPYDVPGASHGRKSSTALHQHQHKMSSVDTSRGPPPPRPRSGQPRSSGGSVAPSGNASIASGNSVRTDPPAVSSQPHGGSSIGPSASTVSAGTSASQNYQQISVESPLPAIIQRGLGDRSNEKRKNAALEIEALIKSLNETNNTNMIQKVIVLLSKDFCTSMNSNYRKGGLVGLAATAIGLMQNSRNYMHLLLPPVFHCFDDPESRVRYYACESLYNIAKVSRQAILSYFNQIFEGLTKLFADVDVDVKNGANLLDRLIKDIVTEADNFQVDQFLPLLQNYIRRTNPYIRQLIVGWITLLDSVPDISMLDYLPDFLDGLFNMLSDSNREIRQAADAALSGFLRELSSSSVLEFGPIVAILVFQCQSKERLNRLTAITWLAELIHHPYSGGDALLPYHSDILGAIMCCISDGEMEIRVVAEHTDSDLLGIVKQTDSPFELKSLLDTLINELLHKEDVPTKMAALGWVNMLLEKRKADMKEYIEELLPVLLRTLSDPSDAVVLLNLRVLSRISLAQRKEVGGPEQTEEAQFQLVLNAILNLFAKDRQLLETRGSLIIRKLCVLLNAKSVYIRLASALVQYETKNDQPADVATLEFVSSMVQVLNLILLTAAELRDLRTTLANSLVKHESLRRHRNRLKPAPVDDSAKVFVALFRCWCHNPVATFSLCLLAQAFDLSFALVKRFAEMEDVSVGFLMQIDKLVHLLESPIFVHLRLTFLDVESRSHAALLKSIYGILLCLPQGDAFRLLNNRLTAVCNLRDNLGLRPIPLSLEEEESSRGKSKGAASATVPLSNEKLLLRYDKVLKMHREANERAASKLALQEEQDLKNSRKAIQATNVRLPENKIAAPNSISSGYSVPYAAPMLPQAKSEGASPQRRMNQFDYTGL
eukprot:Nitzschia sp. Nitz4//scaffold112_size70979//65772//68450//NITZ4_005912-RA/size70979-processed-gene-0.123-mRNA-1//-1//CDS//3329533295//1784//frame0